MPDVLSITKLLSKKNLLTDEQVEKVKLEFASTGKPEEQILKELGFVKEEEIARAKGELFNIPFVKLQEVGSAPEVLALIPKSVAERFTLIPFALSGDGKELSVAFANPWDLEAIEFVEAKAGKKIKVFLALEQDIKQAITERYAQSLTTEVTAALKETTVSEGKTLDISKEAEVIRREPIAKIVSTILEFAIKSRASDVHIEPWADKTRVRYRIDGILHEKLILPKSVHEALVSRIKVLTDMKIDKKRIPQDGRFNFRADGQEVDLRVSTLPTVHGEKIVMRLLKKSGGVPTLPELGLRGRALKNLEDAILRPHGIILICGPTGSGKTTTLYSILSKINTTKVNIVTLEDPVEYQIFGVNQVQVNPAAGLTFASGLRAFLRQDPNIIMVGEIRDRETTDLAIQASLTGHLVFSTIHTKSAAQAMPRLMDMGAEPFLLASTLTAIVAQRICRRVCLNCKETFEPPEDVREDIANVLGSLFPLKPNEKLILTRGKGCSECNNTGYFGRIGIFEVLPVTEKIARLVIERAAALDIEKAAIAEGMITLKQDGYLKALEGITTLEEVLRVGQD